MFTSEKKFLHPESATSISEKCVKKVTIANNNNRNTNRNWSNKYVWIIDGNESIILLFFRTERESFIKKFLAFNPSSLYKADLQRVQCAGREVREEALAEDLKTARW